MASGGGVGFSASYVLLCGAVHDSFFFGPSELNLGCLKLSV